MKTCKTYRRRTLTAQRASSFATVLITVVLCAAVAACPVGERAATDNLETKIVTHSAGDGGKGTKEINDLCAAGWRIREVKQSTAPPNPGNEYSHGMVFITAILEREKR